MQKSIYRRQDRDGRGKKAIIGDRSTRRSAYMVVQHPTHISCRVEGSWTCKSHGTSLRYLFNRIYMSCAGIYAEWNYVT